MRVWPALTNQAETQIRVEKGLFLMAIVKQIHVRTSLVAYGVKLLTFTFRGAD